MVKPGALASSTGSCRPMRFSSRKRCHLLSEDIKILPPKEAGIEGVHLPSSRIPRIKDRLVLRKTAYKPPINAVFMLFLSASYSVLFTWTVH